MTKKNKTRGTKNHKVEDTSNPGNLYEKSNSKPKDLEKNGVKNTKTIK